MTTPVRTLALAKSFVLHEFIPIPPFRLQRVFPQLPWKRRERDSLIRLNNIYRANANIFVFEVFNKKRPPKGGRLKFSCPEKTYFGGGVVLAEPFLLFLPPLWPFLPLLWPFLPVSVVVVPVCPPVPLVVPPPV